jgi:Ca2+-binding EF-hand superfamily protein
LMARRFGSLLHELGKEEKEKGKLALKSAMKEFDSDQSGKLSYGEYMNAVILNLYS